MTDFEPVIGLEVHAQLLTESKLFCSCSTNFGAPPNANVCPVCLGLPGSLPVLNQKAVEFAVRAALALGCTISEHSIFARKNYFYPDLPKGYQISQYEEPFSKHGHLVVEPDLRSSAEAAAYLRTLRDILVFAGVNDGNLEEGSFRCDANVSLRPRGASKFGTRCELKNLNSFRFVQRAIDSEIARQTAILDAGGKIIQETRSFDPDTGETHTLRSKEDAHDYRYFPEPDLPPLRLDAAFVERCRGAVPELPAAVRSRWIQRGVPAATAATLSQHPGYVRFFDAVSSKLDSPVKAANWIANEVLRGAEVHGLRAKFSVQPDQVSELLALVERGDISGKQAKEVYAAIEGTDKRPNDLVAERGMRTLWMARLSSEVWA